MEHVEHKNITRTSSLRHDHQSNCQDDEQATIGERCRRYQLHGRNEFTRVGHHACSLLYL